MNRTEIRMVLKISRALKKLNEDINKDMTILVDGNIFSNHETTAERRLKAIMKRMDYHELTLDDFSDEIGVDIELLTLIANGIPTDEVNVELKTVETV